MFFNEHECASMNAIITIHTVRTWFRLSQVCDVFKQNQFTSIDFEIAIFPSSTEMLLSLLPYAISILMGFSTEYGSKIKYNTRFLKKNIQVQTHFAWSHHECHVMRSSKMSLVSELDKMKRFSIVMHASYSELYFSETPIKMMHMSDPTCYLFIAQTYVSSNKSKLATSSAGATLSNTTLSIISAVSSDAFSTSRHLRRSSTLPSNAFNQDCSSLVAQASLTGSVWGENWEEKKDYNRARNKQRLGGSLLLSNLEISMVLVDFESHGATSMFEIFGKNALDVDMWAISGYPTHNV